MKEIKWEEDFGGGGVVANIGNIFLSCSPESNTWSDKKQRVFSSPGTRWMSCVRLGAYGVGTYGSNRKTILRCKEDTIKMAIQLMDDIETSTMNRSGLLRRLWVYDLF